MQKKYPLPSNESKRLKVLESYDLLDKSMDDQLEIIVKLAADLCEVPIALITILDDKRQWFRAKVGLDTSETPRIDSFCQYAIMEENYFEVVDATKDERFKDSPLVNDDPHIRFYGGMPLVVEEKIALGTLCTISNQPHQLSPLQKRSLKVLAEQVVQILNWRKSISAKRKYEMFFNLNVEVFCLVTLEGYFKEINPTFIRILGYTEEEFYAKKITDFIHPDDHRATEEAIIKLKEGKDAIYIENRYLNKNGKLHWFNWNAVFNPKDGLIYASARDITEEKLIRNELKESEQRYQVFFENVEGLLISLNRETRIINVSPKITEILGGVIEDYQNKLFQEIFAFEEERTHQFLEILMERDEAEMILNIYNETEKCEYAFYFKGVLINFSEKGQYILINGIDISTRVEMEKDLQKAAALAKEHNRSQKDFLANMSHEIRTPLNAIIGFSDVLGKTALKKQQSHYVNAIQKAGDHLLHIVNDILDFSKVISKEIEFETIPFSLKELSIQLKTMFEKAAKEKMLDFEIYMESQLPEWIIGDPSRLKQILVNLLSNAFKFTEKGAVHFICRFLKEEQSNVYLEFRVKDTGIGIPKGKQALVFDRFKQENAEINRKYGGTGLGLSISKRLAEQQAGTLEVESEFGQGSEFILRLAFGKTQSINEALEGFEELKKIQGGKILLVEDNPMNQEIVELYLQDQEVQLFIVDNGAEAMDFLREETVDLILMDLQMPIMDGFSCTKRIRFDLGLSTPIIALTAHSMLEEKENCLNAGMNAYLSKPVRQKDLLEKLAIFLDKGDVAEVEEQAQFDKALFMDFAEENEDMASMLAKNFIGNSPNLIEHLFQGLSQQNYKQVFNLAHKLKPSYKMLGMEQAVDYCEEIEANPEKSNLVEVVFELKKINEYLIDELKAEFNISL